MLADCPLAQIDYDAQVTIRLAGRCSDGRCNATRKHLFDGKDMDGWEHVGPLDNRDGTLRNEAMACSHSR